MIPAVASRRRSRRIFSTSLRCRLVPSPRRSPSWSADSCVMEMPNDHPGSYPTPARVASTSRRIAPVIESPITAPSLYRVP